MKGQLADLTPAQQFSLALSGGGAVTSLPIASQNNTALVTHAAHTARASPCGRGRGCEGGAADCDRCALGVGGRLRKRSAYRPSWPLKVR